MDTTLIIGIITSLVALVGGGGGILAYISSTQKNKQDAQSASVTEWKQLYDEMKSRLDSQEIENRELRDEINNLKLQIVSLNIELENYRLFDAYIHDLEAYSSQLERVVRPLITNDAYDTLVEKRPEKPQKNMQLLEELGEDKK